MFRLSQLKLIGNLLLLLLLLLNSPQRVVSQEDNLNFCDISCVINIYKRFCGDAKCTTGASDYPQRFALCSESCTAAVIGDVMSRCLTQSIPDRDDWAEVQTSTLEEIETYCAGYDIPLNFEIKPQKIGDVDKAFLKSMFNPPELPEKKTPVKGRKGGSSKSKHRRKVKLGKGKTEEEEEEESETQVEGDPKEETKGASEKSTSKTTEAKSTGSKSARSGDKKQEKNKKKEKEEETEETPSRKTKKKTSRSSKSRAEKDEDAPRKTKKTTSTSSKSKEEEEDEDSSGKTKEETSTNSTTKEEEEDDDEDSEEDLDTTSKGEMLVEALGSEASESIEEVENIEEDLEQAMDDSKPSKSVSLFSQNRKEIHEANRRYPFRD